MGWLKRQARIHFFLKKGIALRDREPIWGVICLNAHFLAADRKLLRRFKCDAARHYRNDHHLVRPRRRRLDDHGRRLV